MHSLTSVGIPLLLALAALNIQTRSVAELLGRPLESLQVAPPAFLLSTALADRLPIADEYSLRLLPAVSSLASLWLFWVVAREVLPKSASTIALLPFAASPALIWYGSNVKPYAGDVATTLLLVLVVLRFDRDPDNRRLQWIGGIIGAAAILLSFASVATAAVLIVLLVWRSRSVAYPAGSLLVMAGPWIAASLLVVGWTSVVVDAVTREQQFRYWAHAFPPAPWTDAPALAWVPGRMLTILAHLLLFDPRPLGVPGVMLTAAFAVATCAGIVVVAVHGQWRSVVVLAPVAGAVVAAAARQLPFDGRVAIYAGPPLLIAAAIGIRALYGTTPKPLRVVAVAVAAALGAAPGVLVATTYLPPYRHQPSREVLGRLADRLQPGDRVFVYYGAVPAMKFYGRGLEPSQWTAGRCHRGDPRAYLRELDAFRGVERLWFVYTHGALGWREPETIRGYLETIGAERERVPDPLGFTGEREAAAVLYDLSDPARLRRADADTYAGILAPSGMRTLCDGTRIDARTVLAQPSIPLRSRR
jgi:hypothetical protein